MSEPHDNGAERALLGAILQDNRSLARVKATLRPEDFYAKAHAWVWDAMLELDGTGRAIDHLLLADTLKARGQLSKVGGPAYLMGLDQDVPIVAGVDGYARIIRDRAKRRRLLAIGRRLAELAVNDTESAEDLQVKASQALARLGVEGASFRRLDEVMDGIYEEIHAVQEGRQQPVIPTGIRDLDALIGGLQSTLIVFGARTGVGKSAWASTVIQNIAAGGRRVGLFSLEDEAEWLGWRYLSAASGVNQFVLRYRAKTDEEMIRVGEGSNTFAAYARNVIIDDRPALTSKEIALAADDMVLNHGAQVIVVDHLQEVDHHAHGRERWDLNITESLKDLRAISKRHRVPVVVLAQVNENPDAKPDAVPTIADFSGAKEIAKRSRVAMIATRAPDSDVMRIHVLKQTNGFGGRFVDVRFVGGAAMIRDVEGRRDVPTWHEREND